MVLYWLAWCVMNAESHSTDEDHSLFIMWWWLIVYLVFNGRWYVAIWRIHCVLFMVGWPAMFMYQMWTYYTFLNAHIELRPYFLFIIVKCSIIWSCGPSAVIDSINSIALQMLIMLFVYVDNHHVLILRFPKQSIDFRIVVLIALRVRVFSMIQDLQIQSSSND